MAKWTDCRSWDGLERSAVTVKFDAKRFPVADREEALRDITSQTFAPLEIEHMADRGPTGSVAFTDLTDLRVWSVTTTAVKVQYNALPSDDLTPSLFFGLQPAGSSVLTQRDRELTLRPGDLAVWDSTNPFVFADENGISQHKFRIPLDRIALPIDVIREVSATQLCPDHPISDLAVAYFRRLAARPGAFDLPGGELVSQPGIDLLRAVITTHLDAVDLGKEALQATLVVRIMEYLQKHVREPDLDAGRVAAEHHVSVRQLYRILAAEGISLGDWIRTRRLEGVRRDLASPFLRDPISAVSRRWGFTDASSFARMFRTKFGVSPSEWRDLARQAGR